MLIAHGTNRPAFNPGGHSSANTRERKVDRRYSDFSGCMDDMNVCRRVVKEVDMKDELADGQSRHRFLS